LTRREIDTSACGCLGAWMGRKETCLCKFDWTFPTCGTGVKDFTVGWAALKAASSKW
ncbi:hypothetical protein A2U01_0076422, partial [Trifolium medium]|nr:hypothetical protein [Trifolium medium]